MAAGAPPSGRIFISYRRHETAYPAGWLFDRLVDHYGDGQVFKDVDSIELGDDFVDAITTAVGSCEVLLALIGADWADVVDEDGQRRLDNPEDFVRIEIEAALARDVRVIPVLVDGAPMPGSDQLPASMAKLVRRQSLELSPSRFEFDTDRLVKVLDKALGVDRSPPAPAPAPVLSLDGPPQAPPAAGPVRPPPPPTRTPPPAQAVPLSGPRPPRGGGWADGFRRWPLVAGVAVGTAVVVAAAVLLWPRSHSSSPQSTVGSSAPATAGSTRATGAAPGPKVTTIKVGRGSSGVAVGPQDVWVSNYDDGTVSRLDPASGQVLTTIPVGKTGGDLLACPDAVWVISDVRFIARIDPASRKVAGRVPLSAAVVDLAVRCGDTVWASLADGGVSAIRSGSTSAQSVVTSPHGTLADIDVDPQGTLWISQISDNNVLRLNPTTKEVQAIPVGAAPVGVAAGQAGSVWVTNSDAATVSRVDPTTNRVVATFPVGQRPWGAAVGLGATWVTNLGGGSVSRIDAASGAVTTIAVGSKPDGIAVGRDAVWVANGGSGTVSRIPIP